MPSYKTYTTEQYTKFLKNSTSNNFGLSDDKLAEWFMGQAGSVPVINSYGVTKENLLSTYIPKIKEYQGEAAFFLFYTVTEGGGAGNWINHYQNDTSSTGLGCLIDDLEYCKSIDNNYPGYPVAMTAQEVAGIPPQENINQAQQVYRECGKGTIGSIMMPSTMAGNAWAGADVPAAPQNVTATSKGTSILLEWTAPTTGSHEGWLNAEDITYKVLRYPDEKLVASGLKVCQYEDTELPSISNYYYKVTACTYVQNYSCVGYLLCIAYPHGFLSLSYSFLVVCPVAYWVVLSCLRLSCSMCLPYASIKRPSMYGNEICG